MVSIDRNDGVGLYWMLLELYHPLSREHRRTIETELNKAPAKFKSGNVEAQLDALCEKVREAMDISVRLRWGMVGVPLINTLGQRNAQFALDLTKFRELPADPDDSAVELDKLIAAAKVTCRKLHEGQVDWEKKSAHVAKNDRGELKSSIMSEMKALFTKFSEGAGKGNPRPSDLKNRAGKTKPSNPKPKGKGGASTCQVEKCGKKIEGWTTQNQWKVCGTCLMKCRSTKQPLQLKNGDEWGKPRTALHLIKMSKQAGVAGLPSWDQIHSEQLELGKNDDKVQGRKEFRAEKARKKKALRVAFDAEEADEVDNDDEYCEPAPGASKKRKAKGKAKKASRTSRDELTDGMDRLVDMLDEYDAMDEE
jgi:hypothetical protein